ncbi:MAG: PQQ-like beta-propeller repeat protein [Gammaproteobacteria bacterium]|nr:PQQ-like beta-propeller repeat protein [Gammaproteobacteria bacterium]
MNYRSARIAPENRGKGRRLLIAAWLWLVAVPISAATPANPLLLGKSIVVSQQGVHRFDLDSGKLLWSSLAAVETFEPVSWRNLILVGSTQGLYALAADRGDVVWRVEKSKTLFSPSISKQAFAGSVHGELYAIDPRQGSIVWRRQFPGWIYSPVINEVSASAWTGGQAHKAFALSLVDGRLQHEVSTTQETVFSPIDIGDNRVAFNLFDGSTLVIDAASGQPRGKFAGEAQPNDLRRQGNTVYRSHRDGTLSAFDRKRLTLRWRKSLTRQDLTLHPSQPGYLLASDRDRDLILLELAKRDAGCRMRSTASWILPIQVNSRTIVHFKKQMQPPGIRLVQTRATCK